MRSKVANKVRVVKGRDRFFRVNRGRGDYARRDGKLGEGRRKRTMREEERRRLGAEQRMFTQADYLYAPSTFARVSITS